MSEEKKYGGVWTRRELIDNYSCEIYRNDNPGQSCTPDKPNGCYCCQAGIIQGSILSEQDQIRLREAIDYTQSLPIDVRLELIRIWSDN